MIAEALMCLAMNVYHEARSEPIPAQYAVAMVTLNRAQREPAKVCRVAHAKAQFSWTKTKRSKKPTERKAWKQAVQVARNALRMRDFTKGATHYHERSIAPKWRESLKLSGVWGRHIFYR